MQTRKSHQHFNNLHRLFDNLALRYNTASQSHRQYLLSCYHTVSKNHVHRTSQANVRLKTDCPAIDRGNIEPTTKRTKDGVFLTDMCVTEKAGFKSPATAYPETLQITGL